MEFDATFLLSAISFIVFVFIMNTILYAPVMRIIKDREKIVEDNFKNADIIKQQANIQEKFHDEKLEFSRNEIRTSLDNQMQRLKREKSEIIAVYKNDLYSKINNDKENLHRSALKAKEILKDNVVDIAKDISNILLGTKITNDEINKSQIKEEYIQ